MDEVDTVAPVDPAIVRANRSLAMLLRIADGYKASNNIRQATELYFDILDKHGHLDAASVAHERLLEIAELYERKGELRQARALAERLMELE
jgi:hypothetical protein